MTRTRPTERRWFRWALRRYGLLIARAVYRVFTAMGRYLLADLDRVHAWMLVTEAMQRTDPVVWLPRLRAAVREPVGLAVRAGAEDERRRHAPGSGQAIIDAIGARTRVLRDLIVGGAVWAFALASLRRSIVNTLRLGIVTGGTPVAVANVTSLFARRPLYIRSARIGHTEGHGSVNGGKDAARVVLHREGYINAQEWRAIFQNTRHTHAVANGQVVGVGEMFVIGGHLARYPGDPALPIEERANCQCYTRSLNLPPGELDKRRRRRQPAGVLA